MIVVYYDDDGQFFSDGSFNLHKIKTDGAITCVNQYPAFRINEFCCNAIRKSYSQTAKEDFCGLAISMGSGLSNVALALNGIEGLTFSVARGGDWIDGGAARSRGSTSARMCAIKERGINLLDPQNEDEEAISFYYKHLIEYVLGHIAQQFKMIQNRFSLPRPIPLVVSGGTSMAGGFLEFFTQVFDKKRKRFPIEISEIRHAKDPLNAVALGLYVQAQNEYDEDEE